MRVWRRRHQARWASLGALILSVAACRHRPVPITPTVPLAAPRPRELLRFERTGCFGNCPTYELVLFDDGGLQFGKPGDGDDPNALDARIAPAAMAKIHSTIQRLSGLRSDWCNCSGWTDFPSTIMTFSVPGEGKARRLEHDHSCESAPDWLYDVENSIDETLETERWLGTKVHYQPYHPKKP